MVNTGDRSSLDLSNDPYFTVVIPLYNKETFVKRALNSVLEQEFRDFEVVVVDDGSQDDGPKIVSRISDYRIRLIHQENAGVSEARNVGIANARASRIAFLDADDEWSKGFLGTIYDLTQRYPDAGLFGTAYRILDKYSDDEVNFGADFRDEKNPDIILHFFKAASSGRFPVITSGVCVPKEVLLEVGGFPAGIRSGQDQAVWARIALNHDVVVSRHCCIDYHLHTENNSTFKYFGRDGHFDFLCLLKEKSRTLNFADLECWVEMKMYDLAIIALVHGDDKQLGTEVLKDVSSRFHRFYRWQVQILMLLPCGVSRTLFKIKRVCKTLWARIFRVRL